MMQHDNVSISAACSTTRGLLRGRNAGNYALMASLALAVAFGTLAACSSDSEEPSTANGGSGGMAAGAGGGDGEAGGVGGGAVGGAAGEGGVAGSAAGGSDAGGRSAAGSGGMASGGSGGTGGDPEPEGPFATCESEPCPFPTQSRTGGKVRVILDTDMAEDVDDAGTLAMLHAMADRDEVEILGVVISETSNNFRGEWAVPFVDVINTFYGRPDIPVGIYQGSQLNQFSGVAARLNYRYYTKPVVQAGFPHDLKVGDVEPGWKVYRRLLAKAPDHSVVIVSVGFLSNLGELIKSGPDDISPLNGKDLVEKKVWEWACMGGKYPGGGSEFNISGYGPASGDAVNGWPTRAVFTGFELGIDYNTGGILNRKWDRTTHPVAMAYHIYLNNRETERASWDQVTLLYAIRGLSYKGTTYYNATRGTNSMSPGDKWRNSFNRNGSGKHAFLTRNAPVGVVEDVIDELMAAKPMKGNANPKLK